MQPKNRGLIIFLIALIAIVIGIAITVSSANNPPEDRTQTLDRNGSVETGMSVIHADSTHDVIVTTYKVWIRDTAYKTIVHTDTVPALDSLTTEAENNDGDTKSIRAKRDYQLFITLK